MKVLLTGATGFLGTHVIEVLLKKNCQIVASSADSEHAKGKNWYRKVQYIPLNLEFVEDEINYFEYFGKPDLMIHLAWEGLPNYKDEFHEKINLPRHYRLLSSLIFHGLKDLTVTGTCFEYGMHEGACKEDMEVHPDNAYGRAKNQLRLQLENLKKDRDFSLKWVRLFYMYGEGQDPNSIFSQLEKALERGDMEFNMSAGEEIRDFMPVEKVAKNIVAIAFQKSMEGVINNCSGVPVSINKLVDEFLSSKKKQIKINRGVYPYPDYEPLRFWGDAEKLKKIIGEN
jgi:nucleoside-diphosphate-sugar epimerase